MSFVVKKKKKKVVSYRAKRTNLHAYKIRKEYKMAIKEK